MKVKAETGSIQATGPTRVLNDRNHGQIVQAMGEDRYLDTSQLNRMEQSFREWVGLSSSPEKRYSRQRMLIVFLIIRYTAAKLNEVLALNPLKDVDLSHQTVRFRSGNTGLKAEPREVQISESLSCEIQGMLAQSGFRNDGETPLAVDPSYVRRKFYERAQACGFPKQMGGPEAIRKARAVELMQGNMPLPAVQMMLGHSTPNLTSSYVSFSPEEIREVAKLFMERESMRKTSARNTFFGKIQHLRSGDIQTRVDLTTIEGHTITTLITNDSVAKLGLRQGRLITAEVKAPWIILQAGEKKPVCSAENLFRGTVTKLTQGKVNAECVVHISDGLDLCAIVSTAGSDHLELKEGDSIWALFSCFSVILHVD